MTGTYTPIAHLGLGGDLGKKLLVMVWTGAAAGVLQSFFWVKAPKAVATSIYIALGWTILPHVAEVIQDHCSAAFCKSLPSCCCTSRNGLAQKIAEHQMSR